MKNLKTVSVLVSLIMVGLAIGVGPAFASTPKILTLGSASGTYGDVVSLPITVNDPADIGGVAFTLAYDSGKFEFIGIEEGATAISNADEYKVPNTNPPQYSVSDAQKDAVANALFYQYNAEPSENRVMVAGASAAGVATNRLFNMKFKILDGDGEYTIGLSQTSITRPVAGYATATLIPALVGMPSTTANAQGDYDTSVFTTSLVSGSIVVSPSAPVRFEQQSNSYDASNPMTYPLLSLGSKFTVTATDAAAGKTYSWVVRDWNGTQVAGSQTAAGSFEVDPDVLFGQSGAGVYTLTATPSDSSNRAGELMIRVPMKFVAAKFNADAVKNAGNYLSTDGNDTYTISGGPNANNVYQYSAADLNGNVVTSANAGIFADTAATDNTNVFNIAADIAEQIAFIVTVTLDDTIGDADVTRLKTAGLDVIKSGIFRITPFVRFSGKVVGADGDGIGGVNVHAVHDPVNIKITGGTDNATDETDNDGTFALANVNNTGVTYKFVVSKTGYVDRIVTGDQILAGDIILKMIGPGGGTISGVVTLSDDAAPFASGTVSIQAKTDTGYVKDANGNVITVTADPSDGTYKLPIPAEFGANAPFTMEFKKSGYVDATHSTTTDVGGILAGVALNDTTADITLKPVTRIRVSGTAVDSDNNQVNDQVLVRIVATAGAAPLTFNNTPAEIKVLDADGNDLVASLHAFGTNDDAAPWTNTYSFIHNAYETFAITVQADVVDRDVSTGFKAQTTWTYVRGATPPEESILDNPTISGGTAASDSGKTGFNLPPGGLKGDILDKVVVLISEADAATAGSANLQGQILEINLSDAGGIAIDNADLGRVEITMTFDLTAITKEMLLDGRYMIYCADSMADLVAGLGTAVPTTQIISALDNGQVTFWVDHLSAFGIGPGGSGTSLIPSADRCFIATAAYGSPFEAHVSILRKFRDTFLLTNPMGKAFVEAYYRHSPPVADVIADNDSLRAMVRMALLPLVGMSYVTLKFGLMGSAGVMVGLMVLALGLIRVRRRD